MERNIRGKTGAFAHRRKHQPSDVGNQVREIFSLWFREYVGKGPSSVCVTPQDDIIHLEVVGILTTLEKRFIEAYNETKRDDLAEFLTALRNQALHLHIPELCATLSKALGHQMQIECEPDWLTDILRCQICPTSSTTVDAQHNYVSSKPRHPRTCCNEMRFR